MLTENRNNPRLSCSNLTVVIYHQSPDLHATCLLFIGPSTGSPAFSRPWESFGECRRGAAAIVLLQMSVCVCVIELFSGLMTEATRLDGPSTYGQCLFFWGGAFCSSEGELIIGHVRTTKIHIQRQY